MSDCLISFGSNLGDSVAIFAEASELLKATPGIQSVVASQPIWTPAVGGPADQPAYLNAAVRCTTSLQPEELHQRLLRIEAILGRVRRQRWGSRTADLDLLLFDSRQIENRQLSVPHRRMAYRRFVLQPAVEIAGEMRHPLCNCTLEELLACLDDRPNQIFIVDDASPPLDWLDELQHWALREPFRIVSGVPSVGVDLRPEDWKVSWLKRSQFDLEAGEAKLLILKEGPEDSCKQVDFRGPRLVLPVFDPNEMRIELAAAIQAMRPIASSTE